MIWCCVGPFWMATKPVLKYFTLGKKCEGTVETVAAEYTDYHLLASGRWYMLIYTWLKCLM